MISSTSHSESAEKPHRCATLRDRRVTAAVGEALTTPEKLPPRAWSARTKNGAEIAFHTPPAGHQAFRRLRFTGNLRYLRIPSRFVPVIPTSWGYVYDFILELDGRGRLGLALSSSARGSLESAGLSKKGLRDAPRRQWRERGRVCPEGVPGRCQKSTRRKPVGVGGKQRSGVRHDAGAIRRRRGETVGGLYKAGTSARPPALKN